MESQRPYVRVVPLLVFLVLLAGCAKRPAVSVASAPPAPGAARAEPTTPAVPSAAPRAPVDQERPGLRPPGTTPTPARPAPSEFRRISELTDIHFDFDKAEIRPRDAAILDTHARWLNARPDYLILVEGHCDERGTNAYNLALGDRRAKATVNYLLSRGVQASRFTWISYGEERPWCTEGDESCWTKNRRAHFLVKLR
ncbi:MAG TPA: peptidoglycan-associated lipoprotein Pal [Methylomirabilota bacterium]|jgi:peptidoglycan-associated lipoprotein|nr:peptidoglycan-associated lipoprotein Pal [Methylomirabilota bacterium]